MRRLMIVPFLLLGAVLVTSGCAVRQPGTRTFQFGPDGQTITSDTTTAEGNALADIEKEKTRQVCYKQQNAKKAKMEALADTNPMVYAMIAQTDAINNLASLAVTKKSYDPCPSSTNQADVEIADAAMYSSIYSGVFSLAKTGLMVWGGVEIADSAFSAIAKSAGGYSLTASGDGSSINLENSLNTVDLQGVTGDIGGVMNPATAEPFIAEPVAEEPVSEIVQLMGDAKP